MDRVSESKSIKQLIEGPVEQCWVLIKDQVRDNLWSAYMRKRSEGSPASVEFDYEYVFARDDERHDLLGFFHTHPGMSSQFSERDRLTMEAWCVAMGQPLVCVIDGVDGLRAWWFEDGKDTEEVSVLRFDKLIVGAR